MKKVLCLSMLALCVSNAWAADAISLDKVC